jgi:tRNA pseudouridine13 synthase
VKLKAIPEDFVVREQLDLDAVGAEGRFAIYKVSKRGVSTLDAAVRLAGAAGVKTDAVRFAGLKDKHACTVQAMSVEGGRTVELATEDLTAVLLGYAGRPVNSEWLLANEFEIRVRDLSKDDAARLERGLSAVAESGVPNYFDDQRFGAARAGKGFPALELCQGKPEAALRLLVATPSPLDAPVHRERKRRLEAAWGDFAACQALARGWHEEAVFRHLTEAPGDFWGALRFVPRRERLIQLFAYQSHVWNRTLDRWIRRVKPGGFLELEAELGPLAAWKSLTPAELAAFEAAELPLPSDATNIVDAQARACLTEVLAEDGITLEKLRIEGLRGMEFREEPRSCVLLPLTIEADDPAPDELHPGRFATAVKLTLPKGAYATLVVKRAALG